MPLFPSVVPASADPGSIGVPNGWLSAGATSVTIGRMDIIEVPPPLATRTLTTAWYDVTVGSTGTAGGSGLLIDIGLYNIANSSLICHTGAVNPSTVVGLHSVALTAAATVPAGTRVASTLVTDQTGTAAFMAANGNVPGYMLPTGGVYFGGINTTTTNIPLPASLPSLTGGTAPGRVWAVAFT